MQRGKRRGVLNRTKGVPIWAVLSLMTNGLFTIALLLFVLRNQELLPTGLANPSPIRAESGNAQATPPQPGPRHQLSYEQWVALLSREAKVAADQKPKRLTVLAGDSLSLWFPPQLLPGDRTWLNQGISGETTTGLLRRLNVFDTTQPDAIFLLIGINDLIRGVGDETILQNQQQMIQYLRRKHPYAAIVVQGILPHSSDRARWSSRNLEPPPWVERLENLPNGRIRSLNRQLAAIADLEGAYFLDLHSLFTDAQGNLSPELTTDGLHLSPQGYTVWRSALQLFSQLKL